MWLIRPAVWWALSGGGQGGGGGGMLVLCGWARVSTCLRRQGAVARRVGGAPCISAVIRPQRRWRGSGPGPHARTGQRMQGRPGLPDKGRRAAPLGGRDPEVQLVSDAARVGSPRMSLLAAARGRLGFATVLAG